MCLDPKSSAKSIVLIPLGGIGKRFSEVGHALPKPLIRALGEPILYWLLNSLTIKSTEVDLVLIPYHPDLAQFRFEDQLKKDFPLLPFQFVQLASTTKGAADTLRIALQRLDPERQDSPIISLDGDNFYTIDILELWSGRNSIVTFQDLGKEPIYSYVKIENDLVVDIKEKEKISSFACTGAYGFASWKNLLAYCCQTLNDDGNMQKNEFYISSVIRLMINKDMSFNLAPLVIEREAYICLGTPLQLRAFCNDFPQRDAKNGAIRIKPRRFCFDLDNTLVTYPKKQGDYSTVEPIQYMIDYVQYLKRFDHTIIIYTARRMATHLGNTSAAVADIGKVTFDTLEKFCIPYDEICFGKPTADCYIDDLAVSAYSEVEKTLGFYQTEVKPRAFNEISRPASLQVVQKSSEDSSSLSGEIFYYNHIPLSVKDCFPIMLDCDPGFKWYNLEKIDGVTASNLFLNLELTPYCLTAIMGTMDRIHKTFDIKEQADIDIYSNYTKKIKERYQNYKGYNKFPGSELVFNKLLKELEAYEEEKRGFCTMIHGDPVMTNIIINQFGKIKLIDMRGRLGETLSIRGDETYDWAKLYQSLVGYDEMLQGRIVGTPYRQQLLDVFWKNLTLLCPHISPTDVKLVTNSLLFSLIPLHTRDEEAVKQHGYYELIDLAVL